MTYNIIATGSSGNATIVFDSILVDIGVPFTKIAAHAKEIQLVLLTHQHTDHFKPSTVRMLHKWRPTVRFACCEWMVPFLIDAEVDKRNIDVMEPGRPYEYGRIVVSPVRIPHNVPNCGWKIYCRRQTESVFTQSNGIGFDRIFYATDACNLDGVEAKNFDLYLLECNHHEDEIQAKIEAKQAAGEFAYEVAAARNHLSWEQAMEWLAENGPNSNFVPMHQHVDKE